ncbi:hypothetical protein, partial [Dietzia kunjamensis]|uniref:hypothetical protein n=1 Tax=Dietzia kunjamensis TaxID=322509 RepID=UPI0039BD2306
MPVGFVASTWFPFDEIPEALYQFPSETRRTLRVRLDTPEGLNEGLAQLAVSCSELVEVRMILDGHRLASLIGERRVPPPEHSWRLPVDARTVLIRIASSEQVTFSGRTTLVDGVWLNRSNGLRRLWAPGAAPTDLVDVMRGG